MLVFSQRRTRESARKRAENEEIEKSFFMQGDDQRGRDRGIHLDTEEAIAASLNGVIESGNANQLTVALRDIAYARPIGEIATTLGLEAFCRSQCSVMQPEAA